MGALPEPVEGSTGRFDRLSVHTLTTNQHEWKKKSVFSDFRAKNIKKILFNIIFLLILFYF